MKEIASSVPTPNPDRCVTTETHPECPAQPELDPKFLEIVEQAMLENAELLKRLAS